VAVSRPFTRLITVVPSPITRPPTLAANSSTLLRGCSLIRSTNNEANYFPGNEVRYYNGTPAIGERVPGKVAENIDVGCSANQLESFCLAFACPAKLS
jgi:hypothetical protein